MTNTVNVTRPQALARAASVVGRIGLPQPWAPWGRRSKNSQNGTPNDCAFGFTWIMKDNGGRPRSDYRNGSIRALRADNKDRDSDRFGRYTEITDLDEIRPGDGLLLRWSASGDPDHIGLVTSVPAAGQRWNTTEMNTGPSVGIYVPTGVHRRTRFRANVVGALRPHYLEG